MNKIKVGEFDVYVADPYPSWISLSYNGKELRFHHAEIADLIYAMFQAQRIARKNLGSYADEVLLINRG